MESFIIYMAKASGLLAVFFIAYYIFLRKETFFNSNRWFLLLGLLTAAALPIISYTKVIWVDPAPKQALQTQVIDLNRLLAMQNIAADTAETTSINWYDVMAGIYIAGVLFFFTRFIFNFISLRKVIRGQQAVKDGGLTFIDTLNVQSPFSFFHYIVYNSAILQPQELESILCHEKVHSRQNHSVDMLVSQLFCIAFWFNPFAWLYKKLLSQNLEFIADFEAMKQLEDKTSYQKTLLKITIQPSCTAITNHFYQSLIKKRIVMLNKEQSKKWNSWKYAIVLPALTAFIFLFQIETIAQEKESSEGTSYGNYQKTKIAIEVNKDSKEEDLNKETTIFKERFDTDVTFSNVTRNPKSEITGIKVTVKDKGQSKVYEVAGAEPIAPFTIEVAKSSASANNEIAFGNPQQNWEKTSKTRSFYMTDNDIIPLPTPIPMPDPRPMPNPIPVPQPGCAVQNPVFGSPGTTLVTGFGDKDALVILNGVKQKKGKSITLAPGQNIETINVLSGKDAKKKYGKEAKDGAVEVITGNGPQGYSFIVDGPITVSKMDFEDLPDFEGIISTIDFENLPDMTAFAQIYNGSDNAFQVISPEDIKNVRIEMERSLSDFKKSEGELAKGRAEISKQQAEMSKMLKDDQISKRDYNEMQREIEQAKKEIEQAKKEIQQARKEIELELKKSKSE